MDIKILIQLLLSGAAAFFGAHFALRKFKRERWWERKAEAYTSLIESLHNMRWPSSIHFEAGIEHRDVPEEYSQELWDDFKKARKQVWKITESSSFLISPKIYPVIQEMERGLSSANNADSWFEHLDEQGAAIDTCLKKVKAIGSKDLGINQQDA